MALETALAGILLIALTFYALLGGADFGAGVWQLLARGSSKADQHHLIERAIAPVWEANHVWLILVMTLMFTGFPAAYVRISITLHIPLTLLVIGIVLRGAAFAFRHYDVKEDEVHIRWDQLFAVSSLISPLWLGIIIGTITTGQFATNPDTFFQGYVEPWIQPFPLSVGLFSLLLFVYLAATYLVVEAEGEVLQRIFRRRAVVAALGVGILEEIVLFLGKDNAPHIWGELTGSLWGAAIQLGVGGLIIAAIWLLITQRYWWARACAIFQVSLTLWVWGLAQYPYLIPPDLTIFNAAAPPITLQYILVALFLGGFLLFPSLFYLFRIFKGESLFRQGE